MQYYNSNHLNITQIISQCKAKDRKAEKELFRRFAPRVLTICRRYASHKVEAADLMQECFIRLYKNLDKFDSVKGDFEGWLHRLCTNTVLTILKPSKREVAIVYPGVILEKELSQSEFEALPAEIILTAIQQLPLGYRKVFNLFTFDNFSHNEIAKTLQIAETTSRSQLARAKQLLRINLQKKINLHYERTMA